MSDRSETWENVGHGSTTDSTHTNIRTAPGAEIHTRGCPSGSMNDCSSLGVLYERGQGVPVDYRRAVKLYRQACDAREGSGRVNLGLAHERGRGVALDLVAAERLYRQSCDGGDVWGCSNLGALRARRARRGAGPRDTESALELTSRACAAGLPEACANQILIRYRESGARGVMGADLTSPSRPSTR